MQNIIGVYGYGDPQDGYALEQLINRLYRGSPSKDGQLMPPLAVLAVPNSSYTSDFLHITADVDKPTQYHTRTQGRRLLRDIMLSSNCNQSLLDKHLPPLQIDGVRSVNNVVPCGLCPSCIFGTVEIDVTAAALAILFCITEAQGLLPPKVIMQILTKSTIVRGTLEDDYFKDHILKTPETFLSYGLLLHCECQQVRVSTICVYAYMSN
jgi:hypothetical protein